MANSGAVRVFTAVKARSTPADDTSPARGQGGDLKHHLDLLQAEAAAFAESFIKDPKVRADYIQRTRQAADEIIAKVKAGEITPFEGAKTANEIRNQIMQASRAKLTDLGAAFSQGMKKDGLLLEQLQAKYALKRFGRAFADLSQAERELVWMDIVHAAGGPRTSMNSGAKWYGRVGRGLLIVTLAVSVYNLIEAEDKARQSAKEGATLGMGVAGGMAGEAVIGLMFAATPAGWVVALGMFVGGALLGVGSAEVFDYFWPESKK